MFLLTSILRPESINIEWKKCDVICEILADEGMKRTDSYQSLDFLSNMRFCRKHFSRFPHNLNQIYEYKYTEKSDLGKPCSLLLFADDVTNMDHKKASLEQPRNVNIKSTVKPCTIYHTCASYMYVYI